MNKPQECILGSGVQEQGAGRLSVLVEAYSPHGVLQTWKGRISTVSLPSGRVEQWMGPVQVPSGACTVPSLQATDLSGLNHICQGLTSASMEKHGDRVSTH